MRSKLINNMYNQFTVRILILSLMHFLRIIKHMNSAG